ncbi:unnamed protein product, partial [Mesorhabditis belari]|uniref:Tetratricopeptide repeat protein 27 n=1 Tax=Mesorhabditis belari TaxID=2138241 RepID=A0AAF3EDD4_9BILA
MDSTSIFSACRSIDEIDGVIRRFAMAERREIAADTLQQFIVANWCGKRDDILLFDSDVTETLKKEVVERLSFGTNTPFKRTRSLEYLLAAKMTLFLDNDEQRGDWRDSLLRLQACLTWQKVLDEPAVQLMEIIKNEMSTLDEIDLSNLSNDEQAFLWLHRAEAHRLYFDYEKAQEAIEKAIALTSLKVEVTGCIGRRTHWQRPLPQLVLKTESNHQYETAEEKDLPNDCKLNDDTLLEKVHLVPQPGDQPSHSTHLSPIQLCSLLLLCHIQGKTCIRDDLLIEECSAYLEKIIGERRVWAVQCSALIARSEIEKRNKRKVERACAQVENIIQLMDGSSNQDGLDFAARAHFVLVSGLPTWWKCKATYSQILISLGCTSEALLQYEKLEDWSGVIDCYKSLGQVDKAEHLIRRLIDEENEKTQKSLPFLYTLLGEITMEPKYFEKAIEISGDKFAHARRSFGHLHLARKQFEPAYEHFRRSLQLQPIQLGVWYNAGYCAYKLERYAEAASCFHRCVSLEPEHFEAWNNLSASYSYLDKKERAKKALQEALKIDYEHPNVWENYLEMSLDTEDAEQAILAAHRVLDLKKQLRDENVLERIRRVFEKNFAGLNDEDRGKMKADLIKLYARVTTQQSLSSRIIHGYASLKEPGKAANSTEHSQFVKILERALLADTNQKEWWKDEMSTCAALFSVARLAAARLDEARVNGEGKQGDETIKQAKARNRIALMSKVSLIEKFYADLSTPIPETIEEALKLAKEQLE